MLASVCIKHNIANIEYTSKPNPGTSLNSHEYGFAVRLNAGKIAKIVITIPVPRLI